MKQGSIRLFHLTNLFLIFWLLTTCVDRLKNKIARGKKSKMVGKVYETSFFCHSLIAKV